MKTADNNFLVLLEYQSYQCVAYGEPNGKEVSHIKLIIFSGDKIPLAV